MFEWAKKAFKGAIAFLRGKISLPTQRYDDLSAEEHDWAFTVAGATKAQLLADLRATVDRALSDGMSLGEFKRDFRGIVARHGWQHTGDADWRARTIYETNLRTAYAAGRREQQDDPDVRAAFPYRQWLHGDSRQPRPVHLALDLSIFPADDPFWDNHYPPIFAGAMAWGCKCRTRMVSQRQLDRNGWQVEQAPQPGKVFEYTLPDGRKGAERMPNIQGRSAPGLSRRDQRQQVLQDILDRLPPELRSQVEQDIAQRNSNG